MTTALSDREILLIALERLEENYSVSQSLRQQARDLAIKLNQSAAVCEHTSSRISWQGWHGWLCLDCGKRGTE